MNKKYFTYLIYIFLIISPILDASVTLTKLPISILFRGIFLVTSIIYLLKNKYNLKEIFLLFILMIILCIHFLYNDYTIFNTISNILKLFYLPFIILFFHNFKYDSNINKTIYITLLLYLIIFILSYIFNIGNNIYDKEVGKIGYKAVFNSINELSAILIILYYYTYRFLSNKKIYITIITILMLYVSYLAGTKVLLGGIFLIILLNIFPIIYKYYKSVNKINRIIIVSSILLFTFLLCYLFTYTNTYHNMKVQGDFFNVTNIISYEYLNKVIFNDRLSFLNTNYNIFINSSFINILLGLNINEFPKLVEIDIFDITFIYGIIGLVLITYIIYFIIKNMKNKNNILPLVILLLISLTSGHVLINPAVSIYFGLIMYIKDSEKI